MTYLGQLFAALMLSLVVWAVLASPLLLGFYLVLRVMRRRRVRSPWAMVVVAIAFSLSAAPVPTPIITVFIPHAWALLDGLYYARILQGPALFAGLWPWIGVSLVATFVLALVFVWRYLRAPGRPVARDRRSDAA